MVGGLLLNVVDIPEGHVHPQLWDWNSLCILPNIEGQRYTLGELFRNREEDNEFILCEPQYMKDEARICAKPCRNPFCEIIVKRNQYCITPLGDNEIWINNVPTKCQTKLNFGDYFSFGDKIQNVIFEYNFWFRERLLKPIVIKKSSTLDKYQGMVNDEFIGGGNGLIVAKILCHLPIRDLKTARLVSTVWNEEAIKFIKKQVWVQFDFKYFTGVHESTRLFRYVHEMKDNPIPNWVIISLPHFYAEMNSPDGRHEAKFTQDLDWFLSKGHKVQQLKLGGRVKVTEYKVLKYLQDSIQDLELYGRWEVDENYLGAFFRELCFKNIQKFTVQSLSFELIGFNYVCGDLQSAWFEALVEAISRVTEIRLRSEFVKHFKKLSTFPNLCRVALNYTKREGLEFLLQLKQPLKYLELNWFEDMDSKNVTLLEELFSKCSKTLECLQFVTPASTCLRPLVIHLPTFPKLRRLVVYNDREGSKPMTHLTFENSTCTGVIDYAEDFPSLQSLTLWPIGYKPACRDKFSWTLHMDFYTQFFPEENGQQICKTLRYLNIPYEAEAGGHGLFPRNAEISRMFPNVFNKWTNNATKSYLAI